MSRRAALIHNPASGRGRHAALVERLARRLRAAGFELQVLATTGPGDAGRLATQALGFDAGATSASEDLYVLGGDGTLNEVVAGIHRAGRLQPDASWRLGVVPGGTTNVVARDLGLPLDPEKALELMLAGETVDYDVGLATTPDGLARPFLLCCGVGFDAGAVARVDARLKRVLGRHAYSVAALANLRAPSSRLDVEYVTRPGGERERATAAWVVVGNARFYGGAVPLSRAASSRDGRLELVLVESTRALDLLRLGVHATFGEMRACPGVRVVEVVGAHVDAPASVAHHVDAEAAGHGPVSIDVLPAALRMRSGRRA